MSRWTLFGAFNIWLISTLHVTLCVQPMKSWRSIRVSGFDIKWITGWQSPLSHEPDP